LFLERLPACALDRIRTSGVPFKAWTTSSYLGPKSGRRPTHRTPLGLSVPLSTCGNQAGVLDIDHSVLEVARVTAPLLAYLKVVSDA
jgi:hypothetical protein